MLSWIWKQLCQLAASLFGVAIDKGLERLDKPTTMIDADDDKKLRDAANRAARERMQSTDDSKRDS